MGIRHGIILAAALLASTAASAAAPEPRLTLLTEHSPPASMLENGNIGGDGKVIGSASDKLRAAMALAGVAYTMQVQPWKRAYTAALERPDTCVFSTTRLPEREHLFKWIGPTDSADWVLLGRANRHYNLTTLEDARPLRIGTYFGDARDAFLRERGFKVDPAQSDVLNPRKLLQGRIDVWAASMRRGSPVLAQNGWDGRIVPVLTFKQVDVYLACNRAVPDALVARLNAAIESMQHDGTMKKIEKQYEGWQVPVAK
jgi:polar amino acid transport system substrate-binding protein